MKHRFTPGNQAAKGHGRPVGSRSKINKEEVIQLCNMVIKDFVTRYDELTIYQRIKILSIMKDILRDTMVDPVEVTEPRVFDVIIHESNNN